MKFVIATQELNYLVNLCFSAVSSKPPSPILSNILVEAKNGQLILTATDLTVAVRCATEAKVLEEGATTIPAKKFNQLIKTLTSMNVEVRTNDNQITEIFADSSRFKLLGMSTSEYPELPDLAAAAQLKVKQGELKDLFFRTSFSVSREDNRYALTGVFLHVKDGKATCIGTDGKRLSRSFIPIELDPEFNGQYIIPLKAVEEIMRTLKSEEEEATLYLMKDKVAVGTAETLIISKLLTGEYPDVDKVIPEAPESTVALHREELATLLKQVSLFTEEETHSVKFTFDKGELRLAANTNDVGEGKVSMPVNYNGEKLDIAFNPIFFLDILRHSKHETVSLGLTDSYNPGVITDTEEETGPTKETSPLFVLMPMRLNEV